MAGPVAPLKEKSSYLKSYELGGKTVFLLDMSFTQALLTQFLGTKIKEFDKNFLRFASDAKKFYHDITFVEILNREKVSHQEDWQKVTKDEEAAMYQMAEKLDAMNWLS